MSDEEAPMEPMFDDVVSTEALCPLGHPHRIRTSIREDLVFLAECPGEPEPGPVRRPRPVPPQRHSWLGLVTTLILSPLLLLVAVAGLVLIPVVFLVAGVVTVMDSLWRAVVGEDRREQA